MTRTLADNGIFVVATIFTGLSALMAVALLTTGDPFVYGWLMAAAYFVGIIGHVVWIGLAADEPPWRAWLFIVAASAVWPLADIWMVAVMAAAIASSFLARSRAPKEGTDQ